MSLPASRRLPEYSLLLAGLALTRIIGWGSIYYSPSVLADYLQREIGLSPTTIFGGMSGRDRREYRKVHGVGRACLQCGDRFTARNVQHLLCSAECKKARHVEQKAESAARAWWSET